MTPVFADTFYWYGLANRRDEWHRRILQVHVEIGSRPIVTTEEVLVEFLAGMSGDTFLRIAGGVLLNALNDTDNITVLHQSHETFRAGLQLYNQRKDKYYSLTDCISMNTCRNEGITDVLTNDRHFEQEGFTVLITR